MDMNKIATRLVVLPSRYFSKKGYVPPKPDSMRKKQPMVDNYKRGEYRITQKGEELLLANYKIN